MTEREQQVVQNVIKRHRFHPINLTHALLKLPFMTVDDALKIIVDLKGTNLAEEEQELIVIRGNETKREHLQYLWDPWLPIGKLVHFGGASNQGKSPVTVDLIARITSGSPWPDKQPTESRSVLLMNIEDALGDTIMPRFDLMGGDDTKLFYVKGTKLTKKNVSAEVMLALDRDMHLLCDLARNTPELGMIVIDPITNYLGKLNMNREEEVRTVLSPLAQLAEELNICVVTVGHFNRRERGTDPLGRMMGAAAFVGVARAVYVFGPDPDVESPYAHIMAPARGSIGEGGLRYHTENVAREWDGKTSKVIRVVWDGHTRASAEDAVDPIGRQEKGQITEAAKLLKSFLQAGRRPAQECQLMLKAAGYDPEKVNTFRIRKKANVQTEQRDRQHWWFLLAEPDLKF